MRRREGGFQLLEAIISAAIVMVMAGVLVPPLLRLADGRRVRLAAAELTGVLRQARAKAIRHSCRVGVKFLVGDSEVGWILYRDGETRAFHDLATDWAESFRLGGIDFVDALLEGRSPPQCLPEARRTLAFALAAGKSAAEAREVALSELEA